MIRGILDHAQRHLEDFWKKRPVNFNFIWLEWNSYKILVYKSIQFGHLHQFSNLNPPQPRGGILEAYWSNLGRFVSGTWNFIKKCLSLQCSERWHLEWGNRAPISRSLVHIPDFLGLSGHKDKPLNNFRDFFGTGMTWILSSLGIKPQKSQKKFLGTL